MIEATSSGLDDEELHALLRLVDAESNRADILMNVVIPIGVALAYETSWDHLLERIVTDAMKLSLAEGGAIMLVDRQTGKLKPVVVIHSPQNLKFYRDDPEISKIDSGLTFAQQAADQGMTLNLTDLHTPSGAHTIVHHLKKRTEYHVETCLAVPLKNPEGQTIGVVALSNAHRPNDSRITPFEVGIQQVVESLCKLAAAALDAYMRQEKLKAQVRELTIQIDESKKGQQVSAIADTDYFQSIRNRAKELRSTAAQKPKGT